ncbi:MAG: class I SAM-dependent methyltransferase [Longimicrobiales bacterium]
MNVKRFLTSQLREPTGLTGRLMMGTLFDRASRSINELTLDRLELERWHSVLEVGFGGGAALQCAAERAKKGRVVGVDLSPVMVHRAQRKCRKLLRQGRVELYEGDVHELPFEGGTFHRAFSVNTIYFCAEAAPALREIRRVLKNDGRVVLAMRSPEALASFQFPEDLLIPYSPEDVARSLEEAGFRDVNIEHEDRHEKLDCILALARA